MAKKKLTKDEVAKASDELNRPATKKEVMDLWREMKTLEKNFTKCQAEIDQLAAKLRHVAPVKLHVPINNA